MSASRAGSVAAILAGAAWVVSAVLGWGAAPEAASYAVGVVLLVVALAAGGYALVATAPVWLRAVVTVATAALGYSLWVAVRDVVSADHLAVLVVAVGLVVVGGVGLGRRGAASEPNPRPEPPAHGRRAAR